MHAVAAACLPWTPRTNSGSTARLVRKRSRRSRRASRNEGPLMDGAGSLACRPHLAPNAQRPSYYGPPRKGFDADEQGALEEVLISLVKYYNRSENGAALWPANYLEVVVARR
jgi:hypothetical protein